MIRIRQARLDDVEWILAQVSDFSKFYGAAFDLSGNKEHGRKYISFLIEQHFVRVSEIDGKLTGLIAGLVVPHHFNPDLKGLNELLWWVPDEFRKTGSGKLLLEAFLMYGEHNGFDFISFTLEDNSPVRESTLTSRGFRMKEKTYIKEVGKWQR